MVTHPDPIAVSPALLRRLARDNQEYGSKLATYEYAALMAELANDKIFDLAIDFPNEGAPPLHVPQLADDTEMARLPRINVTLGTVAWENKPEQLPVVGVYCPEVDSQTLRDALSALITAHYTKPFARFVFLCASLRPVPLLGRYHLTYDYLGALDALSVTKRLHRRYGMAEMRHLITGNRLWRAPSEDALS